MDFGHQAAKESKKQTRSCRTVKIDITGKGLGATSTAPVLQGRAKNLITFVIEAKVAIHI